jgi:hypothetical protein
MANKYERASQWVKKNEDKLSGNKADSTAGKKTGSGKSGGYQSAKEWVSQRGSDVSGREAAANNVRNWLSRVNSAYSGMQQYEKDNGNRWDKNYGGQWYEQLLEAKRDYESIGPKAKTLGLDYSDVYADLKKMTRGIQQSREYMSQFDSEEAYQTAIRPSLWYQKYQGMDEKGLETAASQTQDKEEKAFIQSMAANARMERLRNLDETMTQTEIGRLKRQRDERMDAAAEDWTDAASREKARQTAKEEKQYNARIAQLETEITQARRAKQAQALGGVGDRTSEHYDPAFREGSQYRGDDIVSRIINETEQERTWRKQQDDTWGASVYSQRGYDRLSQQEKDTYNYWAGYDSRNGTQKAQEYLDSMQETLNARIAEDRYGDIADENRLMKLAFYTATGLEGAMQGIGKSLDFLTGKEEYTPASASAIAASMLLQDDRENGTKVWKVLQDEEGGRTWEEFLGQSAMSIGNMVPSMATAFALNALLPGLGLVGKLGSGLSKAGSLGVMGAGIAGNTYAEAINQGYSPKNAKAYAMANAASEIGTELLFGGIEGMTGIGTEAVTDALLKKTDNAILRYLTRVGTDGLGEAMEEGVQAIIEPWMNSVTLHTDEALRGEDVAYNMLAGFSTGAIMSAPMIGAEEYGTYRAGKNALANGLNVDALQKVTGSFDADTEAARLSKKIGSSTGAYTIGRALREVDAGLSEQNIRDISGYLQSKNLPENVAEHNARLLNYVAMGGELSQRDVKVLEADKLLADAFREVVLKQDSTVNQRIQGARNLFGKAENTSAQSRAKAGNAQTRASQKGDSVLTDPNRAVLAVDSREGDTMQLRLKDGRVVDSSEAGAYHDENEAVLFDTARRYSADTAGANRIVNGFAGSGLSLEEYSKGIADSYRYGQYGMNYSQVKEGSLSSQVDGDAAYDAYLAGMRWAATQYAKAQKAAMEARQPNQAAQLHFQRKGRTFDGKRESALAMMDTLSKALGEDFWVFESYEKNGKRVYADETGAEHAAPNGFYDKNGVHIDLNAGNDGRGVMLYTLGHELTHYIRQNSPEKFKAFADLIMESFGNRGVSADALIQEQIAKAARNGRNIGYETAYEEMIADSMETILADGKALERLGQIQQKEPSLGQTIRQWAKDTAEKIRAVVNAYKGEKADSLEGRITAQLEQVLPELEELYAEGLADASGTGRAETREGAKKAALEGGVKYQARSNGSLDEAEIEAIQKIGRRSLNSFTSADIRATEALARRYYQEMGEKSPFFRAWFGDWRANDNDTAVQIATQQADARGSVLNADTGWNVQISGKVFNETRSHNALNNVAARQYLPYINDIVSKAVLLDSFGVDSKKAKSSNSLLMHSLYAVADIGNGPEVLKLFVEEMNNPNSSDTNKRAYQLQNIEKASAASVRVQGKAPSSVTNTADTIRTVADLFAYVKRKDSNFSPNPSSKVVNADGTPKAVYHGTNAEFTVFHSSNGTYWFSESMDYAEAMAEERGGNEIMEAFLDIKEPYYAKLSPGKFSDPNSEAQIIREARAGGYDGVVIEADTTNELLKDTFYVVFSPNQIKSATQNIGTFDKGNPDIRFSLRDTEIPTRSELESKGKINVVDLSKPKTTGTFKERRKMILEEAKEVIRQPYLNQDTNTLIFITENSYRHIFNNLGQVQLNAAEHLPELIENAVLTHAEQPTHGSEYATGVYTFFAAAQDGNVLPVKLKVKEYSYTGQEIPRNIQEYFAGHPEDYAAMYDSVVLEVDGIEESPSGSAKDMSHNGPFLNPDELSTIKIADLLDLVNEKGEKYLPQYSDRDAGSAGPYAYDSLVSKPDMAVTRLSGDVPGNRADVIYQAKQNAAKIGRFNPKDGSVSVYVKDMDSDVIIGRDGLKHSIDRRLDVNAPVILKAGEILSNSIRINEMTPKLDNASNSYVLIGAAENGDGEIYVVRSVVNRFKNELVSMDVLYAINAKKEPAALLPLSTEKSALGTGSTISISELLDYVNDYFPDILPEEVLKHYGHESRPEGKLGESVLYSDRDPEAVKRNQILERQNEDLKDTVQYLKELVRLQGKVTDGTVYSRNSVEWAGKQMMKEANAKGDIRELTEILEKTYRAMGEGSEDMTRLIDQAAGWLADHRKTEKPRLDSYAEGILKEMKGRSIALNASQKAEAEALLGSYADYRKRFFGSVNLSDKANTSLDQFWTEMSEIYPDIFRKDVSSADMPRELYQAVDTLRNLYEENGGNPEEAEAAFLNEQRMKVWESFSTLKPIRTVADKNQAKVEAIKERYNAKLRDIQSRYESQRQELKTQRQADLQAVRERLQAKAENTQAAARERYRQQREDLNAARQDIQTMEQEFLRIAREYDKAGRAGNAAQEAAEEFQNALKAEIKKHKQDNAVWQAEFKRLSREYEAMGRNAQRLQNQLERNRAAAQARTESRKQTAVRNQIQDIHGKLRKMLLYPQKSVTGHAPTALTKAVAEVCDLFTANLEQAGLRRMGEYDSRIEALDGKLREKPELKYAQNGVEAANRQKERIAKTAEKLNALRETYARIQQDSQLGIYYDAHTASLLEAVTRELSGKDIYEMDSRELTQVKNAMASFYHAIVNANKIQLGAREAGLIETAAKWGQEISDVNSGFLSKYLGRYFHYQMSPDTFFAATSGFAKDNTGSEVQKMFRRGTERSLEVQREYYNLFSDITENKQYRKELRALLDNPTGGMVDVGLHNEKGESMKITRGMAMQLYMLLGQKDSFEALVYSGLKAPNMRMYYRDRSRAYGGQDIRQMYTTKLGDEAFRLSRELEAGEKALRKKDYGGMTESQLRSHLEEIRTQRDELVMGEEARLSQIRENIENLLTPMEKEAITLGRQWYRRSGQLMADAHEQTHGYRPGLVEDYVPIHRDGTTVWTDIRESDGAFNLENSGFLQERTENRNAVLLTDFFTELGSQRDAIARYYGYVQAQKDFNRLWKTRLPGVGRSINSMIAAKFGTGNTGLGISGVDYVENYIKDIGAGRDKSGGLFSLFYGASASATLSLNPRVAVSQLASIPTAAAVVGWKNMGVGFWKGLGTALSTEKMNDLAQKNVYFFQRYRGNGGITEIADMQTGSGMWQKIARSKGGKALLNWCQNMDVFATSTMYAMAEEAVKSRGMKSGDGGFEKAVNEMYTDIIRKTQPNYTITERSEMLRDSRAGAKIFSMYKTQPNQNLNILMQAAGTLSKVSRDFKAGVGGVTAADVRRAKTDFVNAGTAVVVGGNLMFVLVRTGVNLIMGQVAGYRDDETNEVTSDAVLEGMFKEFLSSMSGMFLLGGQAYDILNSTVSGESYYGLSDNAIKTVGDLTEKSVKLFQKIKEGGAEFGDYEKTAGALLTAMGVPYSNAKRFVEAYRHWAQNLEKGSLWNYSEEYTTGANYRNRFLEAYRTGDQEGSGNSLAALAALSDAPNQRRIASEVRSGFQSSFREKFLKGEITVDEVKDIFANYLDAEPEDTEQMIAGWKGQLETGFTLDAYQNRYLKGEIGTEDYIRYLTEYQGKERQEAEKAELRLRCERDTGYAYDELKETYLDGDITASQAERWMEEYGQEGEAQKKRKEYDFEKETGYAWADRRDAFLSGGVSGEQMKKWLADIEGKRGYDADNYLRDLEFERDNGFAYNQKLEQYVAGKISREQLKKVLTTRGNMYDAEADREIVAYDYIKNHPDTKLGLSTAYSYTRKIDKWDYTIETSGITEEQFLSFRDQKAACNGTDNDGDGRRDSGSVQAQILPIIDAMPITEEQKDTLWYFCGWSSRTLKRKAPWKK